MGTYWDAALDTHVAEICGDAPATSACLNRPLRSREQAAIDQLDAACGALWQIHQVRHGWLESHFLTVAAAALERAAILLSVSLGYRARMLAEEIHQTCEQFIPYTEGFADRARALLAEASAEMTGDARNA